MRIAALAPVVDRPLRRPFALCSLALLVATSVTVAISHPTPLSEGIQMTTSAVAAVLSLVVVALRRPPVGIVAPWLFLEGFSFLIGADLVAFPMRPLALGGFLAVFIVGTAVTTVWANDSLRASQPKVLK